MALREVRRSKYNMKPRLPLSLRQEARADWLGLCRDVSCVYTCCHAMSPSPIHACVNAKTHRSNNPSTMRRNQQFTHILTTTLAIHPFARAPIRAPIVPSTTCPVQTRQRRSARLRPIRLASHLRFTPAARKRMSAATKPSPCTRAPKSKLRSYRPSDSCVIFFQILPALENRKCT